MTSSSFPKTWDKCPVCNYKDTVCSKAVEDSTSSEGEFTPVLSTLAALMQDPEKLRVIIAPRQVTMLIAHLDACYECGLLYCRGVELDEATIEPVQVEAPHRRQNPFIIPPSGV